MKDKIETTREFFDLHMPRRAAKYLEIEGMLTGGLLWKLRAIAAERRLARHTAGQFEATGEVYEQLCGTWRNVENTASLGKPFDDSALRNIQRIKDKGVPEPYIRNWVLNGHIGSDGTFVTRHSGPKLLITRVLGWTWHALTAITTFLFLVYTWALPGNFPNKLVATLLVLCFFGVLSILMNSQSLSALPPSNRVWSRLKKAVHD